MQNYAYDALNRLSSATETNNGSQTWTQTFGYDRYGNRNITSGVGQTNLSFSGNRITTHSYDNAGNTVNDGTKAFTYDAENKQTAVNNGSTGQYFYDGDGRRVKKIVPGTGETTIFVYDAMGNLVAEYSTIVADAANAKVNYMTDDHLGSPRINTDSTGAVISRHDYLPFGEEIGVGVGGRDASQGYGAPQSDGVRQQFTGYERDTETDLDFAQARYFGSSLGRFTSVDPLAASASPGSPQSWNRYAYVLNNPCGLTDSTGMAVDCPPNCPTLVTEPSRGQRPGNIATIQVLGSDTPGMPIVDSASTSVATTLSLRGTPAPGLDVANAEPLGSVEGIARIAEAGSFIPGLNIPFSIIAAATRAGQGNITGTGTNLAMAIPFAKLAKLGNVVHTADEASTGLALAKELGNAGEVAAGIVGPKKAIQVGGRSLFPDEVTRFSLTEVKNVQRLSFTRQLRDYAAHTQAEGIPFYLVTRPGTRLSGPLQRAINEGIIRHKPSLPF